MVSFNRMWRPGRRRVSAAIAWPAAPLPASQATLSARPPRPPSLGPAARRGGGGGAPAGTAVVGSGGQALDVAVEDGAVAHDAGGVFGISAAGSDPAKLLQRHAEEGGFAQHQLEPVMVRGVVGTSDHH